MCVVFFFKIRFYQKLAWKCGGSCTAMAVVLLALMQLGALSASAQAPVAPQFPASEVAADPHPMAEDAQKLLEIIESAKTDLQQKRIELLSQINSLKQKIADLPAGDKPATPSQLASISALDEEIALLKADLASASTSESRIKVLNNYIENYTTYEAIPFSVADFERVVRVKQVRNRVNLRAGAGEFYPRVGELKAGSNIVILAHQKRGDWALVAADGRYGYVPAAELIEVSQ